MFGSFLNWKTISQGLAGLVIVALGVWLYVLRPRDARHRAFALYLFLYGASDVLLSLPFVETRDQNARNMLLELTLLAAGWALTWFVLVYPRQRLAPARQRVVLGTLAAGLAAFAAAILVLHDPGYRVLPDGTGLTTPLQPVSAALWLLPIAAAPLIFSIDLLRAGEDSERSALWLVAVAGAIWPLYDLTGRIIATATSTGMSEPGAEWRLATRATMIAIELLVVAAAVILVRLARRSGVPWLTLAGAFILGPAVQVGRRLLSLEDATGVVDLVLPVLVTIAILRGGLFGVEVKLRFAISKSTVAAVFIAVFFVATEGAQLLFGASNQWVGLSAAGALVFALAPLQRAAERLAEKAVPVAGAHPAATTANTTTKEESYKRALRIALRDRKLTREEDIHLHELAEHLGIGAGRAMALRVDVEREAQAQATAGEEGR